MPDNLAPDKVEYFTDFRGTLGVLDFNELPFMPKRIYWITDSSEKVTRGAHAHKLLNQVFLVLSGSVDVEISKGLAKQTFNLTAQGPILILGPGYWRNIRLLTPSSLLLVLCDRQYEENDYIRDWEEYLEWYKASAT